MDQDKFQEDLKKIEADLDIFEKDMAGMSKWTPQKEPKYLHMSLDQLNKKSPEELNEALLELNRYSLNIQRLINRNKAWERWGKSKSDEITASYLDKIGDNYGFNERVLIARNNPESCKKLNSFLRQIQMRLDRLYDIPNNIRAISDTIKDIKFVALRREREYNNG